jgi:hypothetical protein
LQEAQPAAKAPLHMPRLCAQALAKIKWRMPIAIFDKNARLLKIH